MCVTRLVSFTQYFTFSLTSALGFPQINMHACSPKHSISRTNLLRVWRPPPGRRTSWPRRWLLEASEWRAERPWGRDRGKGKRRTHEATTSIQPEESPPGGQERECSFEEDVVSLWSWRLPSEETHLLMQQKATRRKRSAKLRPEPSREKAAGEQNYVIKTQEATEGNHELHKQIRNVLFTRHNTSCRFLFSNLVCKKGIVS